MSIRFALRYAFTKTYWSIVRPIRICYRFFARPIARGVKVVVIKNGSVLLVRPNYDHRLWTLPGGAVERGESYEEGGKREVFEETGLRITEMTLVREYESDRNYMHNVNKAFAANEYVGTAIADGIEIKEVKWFPLDDLPPDRVPRVDETLAAYQRTVS